MSDVTPPTTESGSPLLEQALGYHRRGWSIIPIPFGQKAARIRWKPYQTKRASESQIRNWFSRPCNIAVVLGEASGGLCCRDYDEQAGKVEFKQWAQEHPELFKQLPITQTADGWHVYFEGLVNGITYIEDSDGNKSGELRGHGGYCLLPPSVHPDGPVYQWANHPNGRILTVDPELAGFVTDVTERTERTETNETTGTAEVVERPETAETAERPETAEKPERIKTVERPETIKTTDENGRKMKEIVKGGCVQKAMTATLPSKYGVRHRMVFEFARHVYSMAQYTDADPKELKSFVVEWHKQALPYIRTQEFEETWIDFLKAWPKIKNKIGEEPMTQIFERAKQAQPPKIAVDLHPDNKPLQLFITMCRELQQEAGQGPFFLACRTGGKYFEVSPMAISRWFFLLEIENIVELMEKGGTESNPRKASRYKYVGN